MMLSLRRKLALSHTIPTLLLLPIPGLYLLYFLEDFYTQSLLQQLVNQAQFLQNAVEREPTLIASMDTARQSAPVIAPLTDSRVAAQRRCRTDWIAL
jgi:hypothetical protein